MGVAELEREGDSVFSLSLSISIVLEKDRLNTAYLSLFLSYCFYNATTPTPRRLPLC